jgi:hypothetical protein
MNSCLGIAWCNEDVRDTLTGQWLGGFEFLPGLPILVDQRTDLRLEQQGQGDDIVQLTLWRKGISWHPDDKMIEMMVNKADFLSAPHLVWLKERGRE